MQDKVMVTKDWPDISAPIRPATGFTTISSPCETFSLAMLTLFPPCFDLLQIPTGNEQKPEHIALASR
jgi:hypothetical protein